MMNHSLRLVATALFVALVGFLPVHSAERLEYNRDVRPILAENCFACHGPDSAARKASLRLDRRADALKAEVLVPGHPEKSPVIERILTDDPAQLMPPPKTRKKLTAAQKETLRRWVASGAEYQPHWSLIPPRRPPLPVVKSAGWARTPIDNFVLAELEKQGLGPAPEADRHTLARRLSLDLTGLPPEPADVERFVKDRDLNAYEHLVDRLLQSPHWGEHRGRYWLDMARYADTHGIHLDNFREIWSYRDWVIGAFNRNLPFDRFTIEQLAGDLLPNCSTDQLVASGFNRCNITTSEGGAIPEEYLVLYTRDRTETTSAVWLGLTANCAVCHDHKFDPLSQREFYEMSAFFNNTTQPGMDGNIKDTPPVVPLPRPEDRPRWAVLTKELADIRKEAQACKQIARAEFDKWLTAASPGQIAALAPTAGLHFHASLDEGRGKTLHWNVAGRAHSATLPDGFTWDVGHVAASAFTIKPGAALEAAGAGDFDTTQAFSCGGWLRLPKKSGYIGAVLARMDDTQRTRGWELRVDSGRVGVQFFHSWPTSVIKLVCQRLLDAGSWHHVFLTYDGSSKAAGIKVYVDGVVEPTTVQNDALNGTIRVEAPLAIGQRRKLARLNEATVQDLRVYDRVCVGEEVKALAQATRAAWLAAEPAERRSNCDKELLFTWSLTAADERNRNLYQRLVVLEQEEAILRARGTVAHIMQERGPEPTAYVLYRGDYDKRRDLVKPATPRSLPPMPPELPCNRLGFAQWLVRPEHPLTARVTVNRFWQEIFGTGIVRTSEDFGVSGELPSHPELLDWLAVEFRESGWDIKRFFKMLVTSAAYRQAAVAGPEKIEKDPQNRLLSRGPRFRMDAEMIRDYALAASGLLVCKLGGPSVKPYQPEGVWEAGAIIGSNTRDYRPDHGDRLYRRSVYTFWKRAAPPAQMEIFNAPTRETCTVRRERTDTPLQALVTLNDPQFIEAARRLAESALRRGSAQGVAFMARRLLARPFRPEEKSVVQASLNDLLAYYETHPEHAKQLIHVGASKPDPALNPSTLAAWTMLANLLMNLDEVLNK